MTAASYLLSVLIFFVSLVALGFMLAGWIYFWKLK